MSFESLLNHFYTATGIEFRDNKHIIESKVKAFFTDRGYKDYTDFFSAVKHDTQLHQELVNLLTTSETYFYREFSQVELFLDQVKALRHKIKILCAPCASGEEPYSLLIAMLEQKMDLENIEIYGIDINTDEISKAKSGIFAHRRLYRLPQGLQDKYFNALDHEQYEVLSSLQKHIHFRQMNLFEPFPADFSDFDVIFSRNMLIYFDTKAQEKAEKIFYEKLHSGGTLFLGHADRIHNVCDFKRHMDKGISFYKKEAASI
jgi:chemotaxis protein methyltransferase CheR